MDTKIYIPNEVVDKIMEDHGGLIHREIFNKIRSPLKEKAFQRIWDTTLPFYFSERWGKNQGQYMMSFYQNCKCCNRHQKNKPSLVDYENGYVPPYGSKFHDKINSCKCPCRHICRNLCREINDEEMDI